VSKCNTRHCARSIHTRSTNVRNCFTLDRLITSKLGHCRIQYKFETGVADVGNITTDSQRYAHGVVLIYIVPPRTAALHLCAGRRMPNVVSEIVQRHGDDRSDRSGLTINQPLQDATVAG